MNSEQFLREAISSGKAPEGFEKIYEYWYMKKDV